VDKRDNSTVAIKKLTGSYMKPEKVLRELKIMELL